ncbi:UbiH/UbiF/VisC/COQ6 family ubiquinone biosynthesis hydroxylase [Thalassotalea sp. 1_MG-2023]|uniref:UbiH/UbiF/VisC/COQ6 family ubiquinone biosynthesis hydroxylase n=1 Tax=Thalassotalea sp. 1_MG-2023 TaxID=3062680 RepID=UPI0026E196F2|nr:UbiH/UbiF/VisC/COQ6 family ubiquinone biosynthesis hydroxylase [Thalassotalea sp. 1_MG-2023]MDO6426798.1 UbiH/UbiF/VisC/COQ6 family ubiquinone biosynthesis hydroxylase [Thalassotalea sp. 1_MG-2023]
MQKFDVLIVGGGMVGLATALAIRHLSALTVAIVDTQNVPNITETPDIRVSAINAASKQLFEHLGVWHQITTLRHQPYQAMHIWDSGGFGQLDFNLQDISTRDHSGQLGWIIENNIVRSALWQKAQQDNGIAFFTEEKLTHITQGETEVFATFASQAPIMANLVIGADGANSWVRAQAKIPLTFRDYDHHAIVATVACEQGHQNTAWQVFLPTGPLAFLPLQSDGNNLCSIVWSTSPEQANRLTQLDEQAFNQALTAVSDGKLGVVSLQSKRQAFPLRMRYAQQFVSERFVLVGDAAHTIHPLAGQGVNLGLKDAAALAQLLAEGSTSVNCSKLLSQYQRWRKADAIDMIAAMEGIKQAFAPQQVPIALARGMGLSVLNKLKPMKASLIKQAMGNNGHLPHLMKN